MYFITRMKDITRGPREGEQILVLNYYGLNVSVRTLVRSCCLNRVTDCFIQERESELTFIKCLLYVSVRAAFCVLFHLILLQLPDALSRSIKMH